MTTLRFTKMHGSGNDFLVVDNRFRRLPDASMGALARQTCARRLGVVADGLILLEEDAHTHFRMVHYNPDGSRSTFCGNGARCAARFAISRGVAPENMAFQADDGRHEARVTGDTVRLTMSDPTDLKMDIRLATRGTP